MCLSATHSSDDMPRPSHKHRRKRTDRIVFFSTLLCGLGGVIVALGIYWWPAYAAMNAYEPQVGDIVFQSLPPAPLVNTIEGVTQSPFSHCGLVAQRASGWIVIEALNGVEETPLREFLSRGGNGGFAVYRLGPNDKLAVPEMVEAARAFLGRPYDVRYRMDDEKIYCSELIYKAFHQATNGNSLGSLQRLGDLNWQPYVEAIKYFEGGPVPLEREMITPLGMAKADQLKLVYAFALTTPADG